MQVDVDRQVPVTSATYLHDLSATTIHDHEPGARIAEHAAWRETTVARSVDWLGLAVAMVPPAAV